MCQRSLSPEIDISRLPQKFLLERSISESNFTQVTVEGSESLDLASESCLSSSEHDEPSAVSCTSSSNCDAEPAEAAPHEKRKKSSLRSYNLKDVAVRDEGWLGLPPLKRSQHMASKCEENTATNSNGTRRSVSFHQVNVRFYEQCAGDNPSVNYGAPIALDWEFEDAGLFDLDSYEVLRGEPTAPRVMDSFQRRMLLSEFYGISCDEIYEAEKTAYTVRKQRAWTRVLPAVRNTPIIGFRARKQLQRTTKENSSPSFDETSTATPNVPAVLEA